MWKEKKGWKFEIGGRFCLEQIIDMLVSFSGLAVVYHVIIQTCHYTLKSPHRLKSLKGALVGLPS